MRFRRSDLLLMVLAGAVVLLFGLSRPLLRLSALSDGALMLNRPVAAGGPTGLAVYPIPGADSALRAGDHVLAIDGRDIAQWADAAKWFAARPPAIDRPIPYTVWRDGASLDLLVRMQPNLRPRLLVDWPNALVALVYLGTGMYVFWRRPQLPASRALLALCVAMACNDLFRAYDLEPTDMLQGRLFGWTLITLTLVSPHILSATLHFALVFPEPLPLLRRARWLLPLIYAGVGVGYAVLNYAWLPAVTRNALEAYFEGWRISDQIGTVVMLVALAVGLMQGARLRHTLARQQWLIVFSGALVAILGTVLTDRLPRLLQPWLSSTPPGWLPMVEVAFPLALGMAVLRYRLFDIGDLINRTLVYGVLTVCVAGVYVLLVVGVGRLTGANDLWLTLTATIIAALLLQPVQSRLQRYVDQRMFGMRGNPYLALTTLSLRMSVAQEARAAPRAALEGVLRALGAPYAAIELAARGDEPGELIEYGERPASMHGSLTPPLVYHGDHVGRLYVAPRLPDEPYAPADERLLRDMLPQVTLAVHTARLTLDLQHSRQRMLTALEDQRRRLRRDLHDGLGPTLATVMMNLDAARGRLDAGRGAEHIAPLLTEARALAESALGDVRRVAYDLRPPALDDLGLTGALRQHAEHFAVETGLLVEVRSALEARSLPAAIEIAAYRIAMEALTNAVRHARARQSCVELALTSTAQGDALALVVSDDGAGLPADVRMGVGMRSMRERADELDGVLTFETVQPHGTRVRAVLPLGS